MKRQAAIVAAMLLSSVAYAQAPNAAEILRSCASVPGAPTDLCKSYVNGIMDGLLVGQVAHEQGSPICLPEHTSTDQLIAKIASFIAAHPEMWTVKGNAVVGVALQIAFPCKK